MRVRAALIGFAVTSNPGACLPWLSSPRMSTEADRAPLSAEVSPQRHPSGGLVQVQAAPAEERLTVGEKLSGRYRIERELGEGGMGVVYLVTDEQVVGETFAVKVLKEGLDPQALQLLREAALARVVGRPIAVQEGPEEAMAPALTSAGMNAEWARLFQELTHV